MKITFKTQDGTETVTDEKYDIERSKKFPYWVLTVDDTERLIPDSRVYQIKCETDEEDPSDRLGSV